MRDFSKISPQVWDSQRFKALKDDRDRLGYLYLLSNTHQNSIGCYRLPAAYGWADLDWDAAKYAAMLDSLKEAGLADWDAETQEIFIPRWFRHNPPTNDKHAKGAFRLVEKIQSERLKKLANDELRAAWDKWQADNNLRPLRAPIMGAQGWRGNG